MSALLNLTKTGPFRKVGDSVRNDYEKGMPATHTLFQVKSPALIAHARKVAVTRFSPWLYVENSGVVIFDSHKIYLLPQYERVASQL